VIVAVPLELAATQPALAVECIGEAVEQLIEEIAAAIPAAGQALAATDHPGVRAPIAAKTRDFLEHRLTLLGDRIAGLEAAGEIRIVPAAGRDLAGQRLAFARQLPSRLGVVVASVTHIPALGPLHLALKHAQVIGTGLSAPEILVLLEGIERREQPRATARLGISRGNIDGKARQRRSKGDEGMKQQSGRTQHGLVSVLPVARLARQCARTETV
jgi:hypothetical protein